MFEQILFPLDGSALSEQALPMVQDLARQYGSTIHLLMAVQTENEVDTGRESVNFQLAEMEMEQSRRLNETRIERARNYLQRVGSGMAEAGVKVNEPVNIAQGEPSNAIVEYASSNGINLIVMSTHGYGGLKRLLLGSVADKVLRSCDVPVLVNPCR